MDSERDDRIWQLLGAARPVAARPMFAADVMRRVRQETRPETRGWLAFLMRATVPAFAACALAAIFAMSGFFVGSGRVGASLSGNTVWEELDALAAEEGRAASPFAFAEVAGFDSLVLSDAGWEWDTLAPGFQ